MIPMLAAFISQCNFDLQQNDLEQSNSFQIKLKVEAYAAFCNFYFNQIIMILPIWLCLIHRIVADISHSNYKVIKNTRAELDIISVTDAKSLLKCTAQCTKTEGCNRANWSQSRCELLRDPIEEISFVQDSNSKYLCK